MCRARIETEGYRAESLQAPDFQNIVDRYYPGLYRFALSLAFNTTDACDLTQQTFSLWASKGHLLRDESKVKSWLFTTLYQEFISRRRREVHGAKDDSSEVEEELHSGIPEMIDHLEPCQVMECLQSINETFRAPLALYYLQDHSRSRQRVVLDIGVARRIEVNHVNLNFSGCGREV
jgi:RNA polymerase sigma-70 factor (ECF subfamily)